MGAEYYRFWVEHHIECKIRFRHVMHFRTGGISGGFKPTCRTSCSRTVSHLADMNCFVIWGGGTWPERAELLVQKDSFCDSGKGLVLVSPPRFCSLSLLGHTSEGRSSTSLPRASVLGCWIWFTQKKRSNLCRHVIQGHTLWLTAKQKSVPILCCLIVRCAADWKSVE